MRRVLQQARAVRGVELINPEEREEQGEEKKARQMTMMRKGAYRLL